jgi:hypothetical protein
MKCYLFFFEFYIPHFPLLFQIVEANARKVGKVIFKPISNEYVDIDSKGGVNRLISKKIIKRKKTECGDASECDDDECPDITENGCPAELRSSSDDQRVQLEDASESSTTR